MTAGPGSAGLTSGHIGCLGDLSTDQLGALARDGDRAAISELYLRTRTPLLAIIRNHHRGGDHEALFHDTWIELLRYLPTWEGGSSWLTWASRVARYVTGHRVARGLTPAHEARFTPTDPTVLAEMVPGRPGAAEARVELAQVLDLMARLPAKQRDALMVYAELQNTPLAGAELGCPTNTVLTRLFYGRQRLAEMCA